MSDLLGLRVLLLLILTGATFALRPPEWHPLLAAVLGLVLALVVILAEIRLRRISLTRLMGGAIGSLLGIFGAFLISFVLDRALPPAIAPLTEFFTLLLMAYCGLVVGTVKGDSLNLAALGGLFGVETTTGTGLKILDTSVIIDGRIADIADTGFLDGVVVLPQFVLRELQLVADSSDSNKRNRGRRGLDMLKKLQSKPQVEVRIVEEDFPHVREVDLKLIELAKLTKGKIVTNDFNLNKVAQLHGVEVLNINELANSLRPVVLPGETMRVFILKEGKEPNQGVAYLDDGTMVVVDHARRLISKTVDITVTSVLQTTAGKMIFGKCDERAVAIKEA